VLLSVVEPHQKSHNNRNFSKVTRNFVDVGAGPKRLPHFAQESCQLQSAVLCNTQTTVFQCQIMTTVQNPESRHVHYDSFNSILEYSVGDVDRCWTGIGALLEARTPIELPQQVAAMVRYDIRRTKLCA
jgi:hypothetical protein